MILGFIFYTNWENGTSYSQYNKGHSFQNSVSWKRSCYSSYCLFLLKNNIWNTNIKWMGRKRENPKTRNWNSHHAKIKMREREVIGKTQYSFGIFCCGYSNRHNFIFLSNTTINFTSLISFFALYPSQLWLEYTS